MGLCLPPSMSEETLQGYKSFRLLDPLLDHLRLAATFASLVFGGVMDICPDLYLFNNPWHG